MKKKILIVDDNEINISILNNIFCNDYEILEAFNGVEALKIVEKEKMNINAILLDIVMPEIDGYKVLENLKEKNYLRHIPVIMITGEDNVQTEEKCLDMGAVDFINKPFEPVIVFKRVNNAIELYKHKNQLERLVTIQVKKIKDINEQIVDKLSTIVEFRDLESGEHIRRVKILTGIMLQKVRELYPEYGLDDKMIDTIVSASALHDVGKISIPDSILLKAGKLTQDEFDIMKGHTTKGSEIIRKFQVSDNEEYNECCYDICRHHHERYDGNGYPDKLVGDAISIGAQVVSIADVYDALVSERVYKRAYSHETSCKMILDGECGAFNPKLLECFIECQEEFKNI
jgi:putative two-component system response regulator